MKKIYTTFLIAVMAVLAYGQQYNHIIVFDNDRFEYWGNWVIYSPLNDSTTGFVTTRVDFDWASSQGMPEHFTTSNCGVLKTMEGVVVDSIYYGGSLRGYSSKFTKDHWYFGYDFNVPISTEDYIFELYVWLKNKERTVLLVDTTLSFVINFHDRKAAKPLYPGNPNQLQASDIFTFDKPIGTWDGSELVGHMTVNIDPLANPSEFDSLPDTLNYWAYLEVEPIIDADKRETVAHENGGIYYKKRARVTKHFYGTILKSDLPESLSFTHIDINPALEPDGKEYGARFHICFDPEINPYFLRSYGLSSSPFWMYLLWQKHSGWWDPIELQYNYTEVVVDTVITDTIFVTVVDTTEVIRFKSVETEATMIHPVTMQDITVTNYGDYLSVSKAFDRCEVYGVTGQLIQTTGIGTAVYLGTGITSGIYLFRFDFAGTEITQRFYIE